MSFEFQQSAKSVTRALAGIRNALLGDEPKCLAAGFKLLKQRDSLKVNINSVKSHLDDLAEKFPENNTPQQIEARKAFDEEVGKVFESLEALSGVLSVFTEKSKGQPLWLARKMPNVSAEAKRDMVEKVTQIVDGLVSISADSKKLIGAAYWTNTNKIEGALARELDSQEYLSVFDVKKSQERWNNMAVRGVSAGPGQKAQQIASEGSKDYDYGQYMLQLLDAPIRKIAAPLNHSKFSPH